MIIHVGAEGGVFEQDNRDASQGLLGILMKELHHSCEARDLFATTECLLEVAFEVVDVVFCCVGRGATRRRDEMIVRFMTHFIDEDQALSAGDWSVQMDFGGPVWLARWRFV